MRRIVSLVPALAALAASSALVAGCGVTDAGVKPGLAVEVDGLDLGLAKVDGVVADYCALLASNPQAQAVPTVAIRSSFARGWAQARAVDALARKYDVALPADPLPRSVVENDFAQIGAVTSANYDSLAWLSGLQARLNQPLAQIGEKASAEAGAPVTGDAAIGAGVEQVEKWLDENDLRLNPVFGEFDPKTGAFVDDVLSVPVSSEAKSTVDTRKFTAEQVAALPASQRCGPVAPAGGAPAGG